MKAFQKKDIYIILAVLVFCGALWAVLHFGFSKKGNVAEIYHFSELVKTVSLEEGEELEFEAPGNSHVRFHLYKDGSIAFSESDCPDHVCIRTGRLSQAGETAACLPNGLLMKIVSQDGNDEEALDAVL